MELENQHQDNGQQGRFFIEKQHQCVAFLSYVYLNETMINADHTFVDVSLRNQGVGDKLIQALRHFIAEKNLKLKASCGYVAAKLRKELAE
ncbi:GNAT family N-acetyltransferase [Gallibacterium anatis]|uniref:GNAT family N-acetyltransferase n=1 Tax=Gallibacterium anatis TaxID=750 RepID=UPI000BA069A6|nr:GNAT family N-acetyltransferase [Gallibacterium anatis]OZN49853.1 GNAT family N-acetyltransferase [Gallibacterium anatis]